MIVTGLELTGRFVRITAAEATKYLSQRDKVAPLLVMAATVRGVMKKNTCSE